jgi:hypothetical protein
MKLVSELSNDEINYWSGIIEGHDLYRLYNGSWCYDIVNRLGKGIVIWHPCTNPNQSLDIIHREHINSMHHLGKLKTFYKESNAFIQSSVHHLQEGLNIMDAGMKTFIESRYGSFVPDITE